MFQLILAALAIIVVLLLLLLTVRFIPNNRVGVVEKRFSAKGSLKSGLIALHGEAGYQPEVLRGGLHLSDAVPVPRAHRAAGDHPAGQDRLRLRPRRRAARRRCRCWRRMTESNNFQDVRAFLKNGGQRGPQRQILREGTYAINLAQFVVITEDGVYYLPLSRDEDATFQQHGRRHRRARRLPARSSSRTRTTRSAS